MHAGKITISAATDAVDAAIITKDEAVVRFARANRLPLGAVAVIGDSANDLPFLELDGLILVGCPSNAQPRIRERVSAKPNGYVSRHAYLDGFLDLYERAARAGARAVISDRDGVMLSEAGELDRERMARLLADVGKPGRPILKILTGSSYQQNLRMLAGSGIAEIAARTPALAEDPYLILAENGSLAVNVLTGECRLEIDTDALSETLRTLRGRFLGLLMEDLEHSVLRPFGMKFTGNPDDQVNKVYLPPKETMVTVDVPRVCGGEKSFRTSPSSEPFRDAVVKAMKRCAHESGFDVHVI